MKAVLFATAATAAAAASPLVDENAQPVIRKEIVDLINSNPASTWKAEESSRFSGMTVGDLRMMMGARFAYENLPTVQHPQHVLDAAPDSFDPRTSRPECTGKVLDQGFCGSCWAFGAVEAISDRLCISKQKQNGGNASYVYLSPLDMTACNGGFFSGENGCQGGQPTAALRWLAQNGVVTGGDFADVGTGASCKPYALAPCAHHTPPGKYPACPSTEYAIHCSTNCSEAAYATAYAQDKAAHAGGTATVCNTGTSMLAALQHGPISAAFTVYDDFPTYKSGVYKHQGFLNGSSGEKTAAPRHMGTGPVFSQRGCWTAERAQR